VSKSVTITCRAHPVLQFPPQCRLYGDWSRTQFPMSRRAGRGSRPPAPDRTEIQHRIPSSFQKKRIRLRRDAKMRRGENARAVVRLLVAIRADTSSYVRFSSSCLRKSLGCGVHSISWRCSNDSIRGRSCSRPQLSHREKVRSEKLYATNNAMMIAQRGTEAPEQCPRLLLWTAKTL